MGDEGRSQGQDLLDDMTRMANWRLHAEHLDIPVLSRLAEEPCADPQVILRASMPGLSQQLAAIGPVENRDYAIQEGMREATDGAIEGMRQAGLEPVITSGWRHEANGFDFWIRVVDTVIRDGGRDVLMRSVHALFADPAETWPGHPEWRDLYDMSLTAWFDLGEQAIPLGIRVGEADTVADASLQGLVELMEGLCDRLRDRGEAGE